MSLHWFLCCAFLNRTQQILIVQLSLHIHWGRRLRFDLDLHKDFGIVLFLDLFNLNFGGKSIRERSQIRSEQDAVSPASLFTPQAPKSVSNSIIGSFGQTAVLPFAEFVVALSDLPYLIGVISKDQYQCEETSKSSYHVYRLGPLLPIQDPSGKRSLQP